MLAQAVLLMTAYPISLSSRYSGQELVNIIATTWSCCKVLVSIILLPVGYYLVGVVKRIENRLLRLSVSYNPLTVFKDDDEAVKRNHYAMEEAHESRANI